MRKSKGKPIEYVIHKDEKIVQSIKDKASTIIKCIKEKKLPERTCASEMKAKCKDKIASICFGDQGNVFSNGT